MKFRTISIGLPKTYKRVNDTAMMPNDWAPVCNPVTTIGQLCMDIMVMSVVGGHCG